MVHDQGTAMPNLRERKKADTRDAIRSAAVDLFCEQGFDETTMDAIADAADVSVRTVFRYFPTKDDLVFANVEGYLSDLRKLLDDRPADELLMASVRSVVEVLVGRIDTGEDDDIRMAPLLSTAPALRRRYLEVMDKVEETIAAWATRRLGTGPADLRPRLLAASMVACQRVVVDAVVDGDPRPVSELLREAVATIGNGFDVLEP